MTASEKDCVFCKIIQGLIPAKRLFEDEEFLCIADLHPQAPTHLLLMPKKHCRSLAGAVQADESAPVWMGRMMVKVVEIAEKSQLLPSGFRTVINTESGGGQSVFHLHVHILGGRKLAESFT